MKYSVERNGQILYTARGVEKDCAMIDCREFICNAVIKEHVIPRLNVESSVIFEPCDEWGSADFSIAMELIEKIREFLPSQQEWFTFDPRPENPFSKNISFNIIENNA